MSICRIRALYSNIHNGIDITARNPPSRLGARCRSGRDTWSTSRQRSAILSCRGTRPDLGLFARSPKGDPRHLQAADGGCQFCLRHEGVTMGPLRRAARTSVWAQRALPGLACGRHPVNSRFCLFLLMPGPSRTGTESSPCIRTGRSLGPDSVFW